ncbi:hypothetical protein JW992_01255, partial [candidate division KSB1 bacterium]|nr:hypothetical protein [candidate division KSB1 bacterium]
MDANHRVGAILLLLVLLLGGAVSLSAQFSFGGYEFEGPSAFADEAEAVGNSLILPNAGTTVQIALTDINLGTWVVAAAPPDYVDIRFTDNSIVNQPGADFVVFEYATPESYGVAVSSNGTLGGLSAFRTYSGTAEIDLNDFGLAADAQVTLIRIQPNVWGASAELSADIQEVAALHSQSATTPTGTFTFDDGTVQGWRMSGAWDESGNGPLSSAFVFGWKDPVHFPLPPGRDALGNNHGSLMISTLSGHGITNPGATWWIQSLHSPDLSQDPLWQTATGYSVEIAECMASMSTLYANLYVTLYDEVLQRDRYFYNGTARELQHDSYNDDQAVWNHLTFDWSASLPERYTVKEL